MIVYKKEPFLRTPQEQRAFLALLALGAGIQSQEDVTRVGKVYASLKIKSRDDAVKAAQAKVFAFLNSVDRRLQAARHHEDKDIQKAARAYFFGTQADLPQLTTRNWVAESEGDYYDLSCLLYTSPSPRDS